MITEEQCAKDQQASFEPMRNAGLFVAEEERSQIEMADFGLGQFRKIGLGVPVYVTANSCCAKSPLQRRMA